MRSKLSIDEFAQVCIDFSHVGLPLYDVYFLLDPFIVVAVPLIKQGPMLNITYNVTCIPLKQNYTSVVSALRPLQSGLEKRKENGKSI